MGLGHQLQAIEMHNREIVAQCTFGHLAPVKNTAYKGRILFCKSEYCSGSLTVISTDATIDSSPWFYDAMHEFLYSFKNLEEGSVYSIDFTFRNYRWWGTPVQLIKIKPFSHE